MADLISHTWGNHWDRSFVSECSDQQLAKNRLPRNHCREEMDPPLPRTSPRAVGLAEFRLLTRHDYLHPPTPVWIRVADSDQCPLCEGGSQDSDHFNFMSSNHRGQKPEGTSFCPGLLVCKASNDSTTINDGRWEKNE